MIAFMLPEVNNLLINNLQYTYLDNRYFNMSSVTFFLNQIFKDFTGPAQIYLAGDFYVRTSLT